MARPIDVFDVFASRAAWPNVSMNENSPVTPPVTPGFRIGTCAGQRYSHVKEKRRQDLAMMSAMAEDERLRIIKRTHEGRKIAQAKGVRMGRKPILTPHQKTEARRRIAKGESTRIIKAVIDAG